MNLGQILTAQRELGYAADTDVARTSMTNSVQRRICNLRRWPFLKTLGAAGPNTVAGTSQYNLAASIASLKDIDAVSLEPATGDGIDIAYLDNEEFRRFQRVDATRGTPCYWTSTDKVVHLWPTPSSVWTLRVDHTIRPVDLVNAGDNPTLPVEWHDLLVWGPIVEMAHRERDEERRQQALGEFDQRLLEMMHQYGMVQRQTSKRVVRSGYWDAYDFAEDYVGISAVWSR